MSDTYVKNRQKRSAPSFGGVYTPLSHPPSWASDPNWDELANLPNHSRKLYVLVGGIPTPLKKESVGMVIPFPTEWKVIKFRGSSHHQAVFEWLSCCWGPLFWYPEGPWLVSAFELCKSQDATEPQQQFQLVLKLLSSLLVGEERDSH